MKNIILSLNDVDVVFDDVEILKKINLQVYEGETIVLIGPSGGGKTVLLKTMAGVYSPTQGHVLCYGMDWQSLNISDKHQLAAKVGMQFQKGALFDNLTAIENIEFPLREHLSWNEKELKDRARQCLADVGLEGAANQFPHELSGGMRQRLSIARAIAMKPELLFLDDPTAGLDPLNSDKMAELIIELRDKTKATVVLVTHDMARAYQLAGTIYMVADKEVIFCGDATSTKAHTDPRVQQFINGRLTGPLKIP